MIIPPIHRTARPALRHPAPSRFVPPQSASAHRLLHRILLIAALLFPSPARAQDLKFSFPLGEFYKPGRFIPIRITGALSAGGTLLLQADNAITLSIPLRAGAVDITLPWLLPDEQDLKNPRWTLDGADHPLALHAPDDPAAQFKRAVVPVERQQILVLCESDSPAVRQLLAHLAPGKPEVIPIIADAARPLPGTPIAWESLDAILLQRAPANLDSLIASLLPAGAIFAIHQPSPPDGRWPWRSIDGWQVLRRPAVGYSAFSFVGYDNSIYDELRAPDVSFPSPVRIRILLFSTLFSLLVLAALLVFGRRPPAAIPAPPASRRRAWQRDLLLLSVVAALSIGAFFALRAWGAAQEPIVAEAGHIQLRGPGITQFDDWTFLASPRPAPAAIPWNGPMHPFFKDAASMRKFSPILHCSADGAPLQFAFTLPPFNSDLPGSNHLALLKRTCAPRPSGPGPAAALSALSPSHPLRNLLIDQYRIPYSALRADAAERGEPPTVIVDRP